MSRRERATQGHAISSFFVFCLIAVFAVLATLLTLFGIRAYRSVYDASASGSEEQIVLSYLANKVRMGDRAGGVTVGREGGMDVLTIREPLDGGMYETRIYCDGESLCEYFCEAGDGFDAELGTPLVALKSLRLAMEEPWLISLRAEREDGVALDTRIALRGEASP